MNKTLLVISPELLESHPRALERIHSDYIYAALGGEIESHSRSLARTKIPALAPSVVHTARLEGRLELIGPPPDVGLKELCQDRGISEVIHISTWTQLRQLQELPGWTTKSFLDGTLEQDRKMRNEITLVRLLGILLFSLLVMSGNPLFVSWVLNVLPSFGVGVFVVVLGVLLFAFRSRWRRAYGIIEVLFGLTTATLAALPVNVDWQRYLQVMAGLYVVVRGLENLGKGGLARNRYWQRLFPESTELTPPTPKHTADSTLPVLAEPTPTLRTRLPLATPDATTSVDQDDEASHADRRRA